MVNLDRFLAERRPAWSELEALLARAAGRPERIGPEGVRRLGELYRGVSADLATARRLYPSEPEVSSLADLAGRAHALVYGAQARRESVGGFLARRYWRRIGERPALLVVSAVLLLAPALVAGAWAWADPGQAGGLVPSAAEPVARPRPRSSDLGLTGGEKARFSAAIFTNNIRVTLVAVAGGVSAGILTAGVLVLNGALIGVVGGLGAASGNGALMAELILPHGVLELSCIVVAGAAGLRMGWALVDPGRRRRSQALVVEARAAVEIALGTAPWLVLAGLIEGLVTPSGIGVGPAVAVGLAPAAAFWALAVARGGPEPPPPATAGPAAWPAGRR